MLVLITYDVNTETVAGRSRLRKVAKQCTNYGQRVQNSVFECNMDAAKCRQVKAILEEIIDKDKDSLRFYYLGDNYKNKVEHIGAKPGFDVTETLFISIVLFNTVSVYAKIHPEEPNGSLPNFRMGCSTPLAFQ